MSYFRKLTKAKQVSKFQNLKCKMHSKSDTVCTAYTTHTTLPLSGRTEVITILIVFLARE
jgi:hypothetical protein